MGLRNAITRIRDSRSGDTTDPLDLAREEFVAESFGPEPEDTDPGGADLTDPAAIPPGAHRSTQTKYGVGVSRCGVLGCGTHTTGLVCSVCTAAGRLADGVDGLERILPDPPLDALPHGFLAAIQEPPQRHPYGFAGEDVVDVEFDEEDDLPTLDECGPFTAAMVEYDAAKITRRLLVRSDQLGPALVEAFTCDRCGAPLGPDTLCSDYGPFHHQNEHLDAERLLGTAETVAEDDQLELDRRLHDAG